MAHPLHLWITIPVKPLAEGKSRLASAVADEERQRLTRHFLQRTLQIVLSPEWQADNLAGVLAGVIVVSRDREILALAEEAGALALAEQTNRVVDVTDREWGLNRAVGQAAAYAQQRGGHALLFLPTDLPLLQAEDIRGLVAVWGERKNCLVIASSQTGGTNALLLAPPDAIAPAFGVDSFARHTRLARQAGLAVEVVESPNLAWDVDTPEEYHILGRRAGFLPALRS